MSLVADRNNFLSIPDILASQERVPCTFSRSVTHLDPLDPSSGKGVLNLGSSLELPLWMGQILNQYDLVNIELPTVYKSEYRDVLKADANVVDLHHLSKFFYEFGKMVASNQRRGVRELVETLIQTFKDRADDILERALVSSETTEMEKLDCLEREIVARGKHANSTMDQWLSSSACTIKMASLVVYHKKRRLIETAFS